MRSERLPVRTLVRHDPGPPASARNRSAQNQTKIKRHEGLDLSAKGV